MNKTKIPEAIYLEKLGNLYEKIRSETPEASVQELYEIYREQEFELLVDFRLGTDFPKERRQELYNLQREVISRMEELTASLSSKTLAASGFAEVVQEFVTQLKLDLAGLLDADELNDWCGDGFPGIPLDPELLGKA